MPNRDLLIRVYATIKALRDTVASETSPIAPGLCADDFNAALERLVTEGADVAEFKVPSELMAPHRTLTNYITKEYRLTERRVDRGILLAKMNAVLMYFNLTSEDREPVKARGPRAR